MFLSGCQQDMVCLFGLRRNNKSKIGAFDRINAGTGREKKSGFRGKGRAASPFFRPWEERAGLFFREASRGLQLVCRRCRAVLRHTRCLLDLRLGSDASALAIKRRGPERAELVSPESFGGPTVGRGCRRRFIGAKPSQTIQRAS